MSLEKAIQENTEALKALTAALQNGAAPAPAKEEPKKEKAKKEAPAKEEAPKEEPKAEEKAKSDAIPYDDVKNKTLELVKAKGRDVVMSLLEDFGSKVKSAKDLEEGQYAEYLERVEDLLKEDDVA